MLAKCSARGQCSRWSHIRGAPHHAVRAPHPTTHWGTARCEKTCLRRIDPVTCEGARMGCRWVAVELRVVACRVLVGWLLRPQL